MSKLADGADVRGFFGIGIYHGKSEVNLGTLWRSAHIFGASFVFTIGRRYRPQASDTLKTWRHVPLYHYGDCNDFYAHLPYDCQLVGVELDARAVTIGMFAHPTRAVYLLGAEDHGLAQEATSKCHRLVQLPGKFCMNVAVAGSLVMFHRTERASSTEKLNELTA